MEDKSKKEMIEKTVQEFQKLNEDNKMFILGYMLGVQQGRQAQTAQEEQDGKVQRTDNAPSAGRVKREAAGGGGADGNQLEQLYFAAY